jgi:hypothetical protein
VGELFFRNKRIDEGVRSQVHKGDLLAANLLAQITLQECGSYQEKALNFLWLFSLVGVTGKVTIDENGDRDGVFSILDMNPDTGQFEVRLVVLSLFSCRNNL